MKRLLNKNAVETAMQLRRPAQTNKQITLKVQAIINAVAERKDKALYEFEKQFGNNSSSLAVTQQEISGALSEVSPELKKAIRLAAKNIRKFHTAYERTYRTIETSEGVRCWKKNIPIERVGLYIPGGSAPLFSTLLMLGIPARIAGCKEIIVCTPANKSGRIDPAILFTANLLGLKNLYKCGGAQAIAAMALGTESIPKVNKIFGPGNSYVTAAKQLLSPVCAIDMPAGPSELAVIADEKCNPAFVAADLLSQAEHGEDSQVILLSTRAGIIDKVNKEIEAQLKLIPRRTVAEKALLNSFAIEVKNIGEAMDISNRYAPEHLILACKNAEKHAKRVYNAGSVFIGNYSCESAGDYASGTNHTLPTSGFAKSYSGVSTESFRKQITFQKVSKKGLKEIGPAIELMAEAEGLKAHSNAVTIRLKKNENRYKKARS